MGLRAGPQHAFDLHLEASRAAGGGCDETVPPVALAAVTRSGGSGKEGAVSGREVLRATGHGAGRTFRRTPGLWLYTGKSHKDAEFGE